MDRRRFITTAGIAGATAVVTGGASATLVRSADRRTVEPVLTYRGGSRGSVRVWWSVTTEERIAALTFDDGPEPRLTPRVLDVLADADARATFFVVGEMARRHPDLLLRSVEDGHEIGNHGEHHRNPLDVEPRLLRSLVTEGADTIEALTGRRPRFYRPPRGQVTGSVLAAAAAAGSEVVLWSVSRGGGDIGDGDDADVERSVLDSMAPGAITCLHDGYGASGEQGRPESSLVTRREAELRALPRVLHALAGDGWSFVTLSELIALDRPNGPAHEGAPPLDEPVLADAGAEDGDG